MMFKSKHSGWTWDLKRTPFGGGGGLGNFFAEIDPVEAFKGAANSTADAEFQATDWMSENGWMLPVAMVTAGVASGALGGGALAADGSIAAGSAELAGPSLAGSQAFDAAIASGLSTAEASAAADAAAQAAIGTGQGIGTAAGATAGATQALPYTEAFDAANLASNGSNAASIAQNLTATGMDSFLAQDMANLAAQGLTSAQIASTLAASYTPAELAGTGIQSLNWAPASGTSFVDALKTANQVRQGASTLSKLLKSGSQFGGSQLANATQNLAQGQTKMPMAIPALIRGNQNPFVMTQNLPIQNKKTDLTSLAELLKQG